MSSLSRESSGDSEKLCSRSGYGALTTGDSIFVGTIVGELCKRLVWELRARPAGVTHFIGCFQPHEDGSLRNERGEIVKPKQAALVLLAGVALDSSPVSAESPAGLQASLYGVLYVPNLTLSNQDFGELSLPVSATSTLQGSLMGGSAKGLGTATVDASSRAEYGHLHG